MRKYLSILFLVLVLGLAACDNENVEKEVEKEKTEERQEATEEKNTENEDDEQETTNIDTSMYEYSTEVEVTDAIEVNDYVSLIIRMNDSLEPGLAFQHATNQTYDFLQQESIDGAEKVGINIILNDQKIAMYEITLDEFETNDEESMAQLVLDASVMNMIVPEVEEYAEVMELKYEEE